MGLRLKKHTDKLRFLEEQGFAINPLNSYSNNINEVWEISKKLSNNRSKLHYGIDGLVVKVNELDFHRFAGIVGKTPRAHCAIKFPAEEAVTKVTHLVWQVGRTGKITPVVEFEPTPIAGTTVRRATLHNYKEFEDSNLHLSDTLVIRKAGDIIPEVVSILSNIRPKNALKLSSPSHCPECNTEVIISKTGVDLYCPNTTNCDAQVKGRLTYYAQRSIANITGLSEKQIEKFVEEYDIQDIYDLYTLPFDAIQTMEGYGEKSVSLLKESIQSARKIKDKKFLAGLSIEGVGIEVAQLILQTIYEKLDKQNPPS